MLAGRTEKWPSGSPGFIPLVVAFATHERTDFTYESIITALNINGFTVYERIRHGVAGLLHNPPEGRTRYTHFATRFRV
jgi:hypothetical protein